MRRHKLGLIAKNLIGQWFFLICFGTTPERTLRFITGWKMFYLGGVIMWLGMGSFEMALVYVLCIAAGLWCLVYGLFFWKTEDRPDDVRGATDWEKEERELQ
jgi:hypothetical protein